MSRLLIWLILVLVAWWWIRRHFSPPRPPVRDKSQAAGRKQAIAPPEAMIDCVRCGLHLPASEAVRDPAGRPYCCAEHRDAGPDPRG